VDDVRRLPPGAIANIQISDRTPLLPGSVYTPMTGRQIPGKGRLPLRALMAAALANSPDATADIEALNEEFRDLPIGEAAALLAAAVQDWRATLWSDDLHRCAATGLRTTQNEPSRPAAADAAGSPRGING
jgi:hypothetical protein